MANTVNFYSASYDKIQSYIDSGTIPAYSYVQCKDDLHKNELIFIDKDKVMQPVVGYQQSNLMIVPELPTEGYRTDVIYVCNNTGYLFINDVPVPIFKEIDDATVEVISSYDNLSDIPMVNLYGSYASPVIVSDLDIGNYTVTGSYKIGETVYSTSRKVQFIIDADESNKYITRFDANQVVVYTVTNEEITQDKYATESWVLKQGYATETYVTEAINASYNKIAEEILAVKIIKVSQLENDIGYLTEENFNGIGKDEISSLF